MDMLDVFAMFGLERVTDKIEDRYGSTVAWWATLVICLSFLGIVGAVLYAML